MQQLPNGLPLPTGLHTPSHFSNTETLLIYAHQASVWFMTQKLSGRDSGRFVRFQIKQNEEMWRVLAHLADSSSENHPVSENPPLLCLSPFNANCGRINFKLTTFWKCLSLLNEKYHDGPVLFCFLMVSSIFPAFWLRYLSFDIL